MEIFMEMLKRPFVLLRNLFRILFSVNRRFNFFFTPGHYYSPIPDLKEVREHAKEVFDSSKRDILGIDLNEEEQIALLKEFAKYHGDFAFPANKEKGTRYYYDNSYYSIGDGMILYSMIRHFKPARILEVGSGYSSALMLDVDGVFLGGETDFTFIEPNPERLYSLISAKDRNRYKVVEGIVQNVSEEIFHSLSRNDFLFIDSSHVAKTHSDLLHLVFRVLPIIKPGVIIHFHDIFWPFEYPQDWLEVGRAWNEAYFLRSFLQYNNSFKILYYNSFIYTHHKDALKDSLPYVVDRSPRNIDHDHSSLWLQKTDRSF